MKRDRRNTHTLTHWHSSPCNLPAWCLLLLRAGFLHVWLHVCTLPTVRISKSPPNYAGLSVKHEDKRGSRGQGHQYGAGLAEWWKRKWKCGKIKLIFSFSVCFTLSFLYFLLLFLIHSLPSLLVFPLLPPSFFISFLSYPHPHYSFYFVLFSSLFTFCFYPYFRPCFIHLFLSSCYMSFFLPIFSSCVLSSPYIPSVLPFLISFPLCVCLPFIVYFAHSFLVPCLIVPNLFSLYSFILYASFLSFVSSCILYFLPLSCLLSVNSLSLLIRSFLSPISFHFDLFPSPFHHYGLISFPFLLFLCHFLVYSYFFLATILSSFLEKLI